MSKNDRTRLLSLAAIFAATLASFPLQATAANESSIEEYRRQAMERDGDAARGQRLFADATRLSCATCHSIDGKGTKAGPDLFAVGDQFARRDIIEAILHPSANIAVGYGTTVVETFSGEEYLGILKLVTGDRVELATPNGERLRLRSSEIKARRVGEISLMPEGLHQGLTPQEFCDLVQYLVSLKERPNSAAAHQGMPETIPQLSEPVLLRALLEKPLRFEPSPKQTRTNIQTGLVAFAQRPGLTNVFRAADQVGVIWRIEKNATGAKQSLFGDFTMEVFSARGPNGLLGLAFHPKFKENRKYYLKHQIFEEGKIATVLAEKLASQDFKQDSGEPTRRLLKIDAVAEHHNGGCIQFGPDGFLYFGMGDSAPNHDPQGHGQDLRLLLGKMLRLDVDRSRASEKYAIPADNPFRGIDGTRPEIWAAGFREPWRFSFDALTGDLWVADLGQERGDEVSIVRRGENHGWNVYEGFELFSNQYRKESANYVAPLFSLLRRHGSAVVGGCVYRGNPHSPLYGFYIFGDHTSKRIWALQQENRMLKQIFEIADSPQSITAFATDELGGMYVVGYQGMIYQLDFSGAKLEIAKRL
jgi:putative heme-binding domain-containing protein